MGIEPTSSAWKAEVLPLNYTRILETVPSFDLAAPSGSRFSWCTSSARFMWRKKILTVCLPKTVRILLSLYCVPSCQGRTSSVSIVPAALLLYRPPTLYKLVEGVGFEPT